MFKYVSDIISQFSNSQKILALLILCFSVILITILPSFISAITLDKEELEKRITERDYKISSLIYDLNSLDSTIRSNQMICTNEAFKREIDFKKMLQEIQDDLILSNYRNKRYKDNYIVKDTLALPIKVNYQNTDMSILIKKVEKMKKEIKDK